MSSSEPTAASSEPTAASQGASQAPQHMTGGAAFVQALERHGVDTVFGIPGVHNLEIYRHLAASSIRHVAVRHEQGGGYAADGYARASGRPGVCLTTSGPGATNACTAAATAYADSVPMLLCSPGPPIGVEGLDLGLLHEMKDQSAHFDSLVAASVRPSSPEEIGDVLDELFAGWQRARPRPVHLELPIDVIEGPWQPVDTGATRTGRGPAVERLRAPSRHRPGGAAPPGVTPSAARTGRRSEGRRGARPALGRATRCAGDHDRQR
jgi:thiamine pyrophosphate-dependent acetolactate synthase large subunit-like protein